ncbi:tyrosine-protein kinase STYK1-like [Salarias fasciatus]|uniref:Tyrosine-protein kinase STYK1-like n=1 Tax=Salarias fasciatus TaxID=181472 RepID=A0A672I2V9_SALFA|nr:tyrosine-protein kinase STYK1-like [Salarias fasciatus]XP_029976065.1 tyrosine-protein kinase STYK1-like [Salarias fasciatus]
MSSNSTECAEDDRLCIATEHQLAVIIVPVLLVAFTLITLVIIFILLYCPDRKQRRATSPQRYHGSSHRDADRDHRQRRHQQNHRPQHHRSQHRRHLHGIDAPPGINPLEHEEVPMSVQQVQQNVRPTLAAAPQAATERQHGSFSQVAVLPSSFSIRPDDTVSLYRARMENRNVVLRVLKETASSREKQHFLGFASFVAGLGPHPSLPALLGVVSERPPLMIAVEEVQHRDLLGFLWRCRQESSSSESSCYMTEKRIFTMAAQVASALHYLHSQNCIHGNVGAHSVLVGRDLTAKLWGLGPAYRRRAEAGSPGEVEDMELKKWQAPEVLARRLISQSSDVWSFGILLYEMVTLGDPPFAQLMATELLQHLQRGHHLTQPASCSNALYSILRSCCRWNSHNRLSTSDLIGKLYAGEKSANGRTILRAPGPINFEDYLREAGYGEAYNYAVL